MVLKLHMMAEGHVEFWQVLEEMQREREDDLRSQAESLAVQMATIHYQKAERWIKVLETSRALLTMHSFLIQQLRERKTLERQDMAHSIQHHCLVGGAFLTVNPSVVALHG